MIIKLFTIFDTQAERAIQPILRENVQIAMRDFEMIVAGQKPFSDNPDDYILYEIGEWNDETMYLTTHDPKRLYHGLDAYKNRQVRQDKLEELQHEINRINAGGTD